jgi:hypothetical protein
MASFGITGLVIAGATVALTAPAEAAAKKCAVGNWSLTKLAGTNVATFEGKKVISKITGGVGTKLKITASAATYNFSKSKPVILTGNVGGVNVKGTFTYRKSLTHGLKLTGAAKGTFTPNLKKISGTATVKVVISSDPNPITGPVVPQVKSGDDLFVIRTKAVSTCTKKTLTLSQQKVKENDGSITTRTLSYRRTK